MSLSNRQGGYKGPCLRSPKTTQNKNPDGGSYMIKPPRKIRSSIDRERKRGVGEGKGERENQTEGRNLPKIRKKSCSTIK